MRRRCVSSLKTESHRFFQAPGAEERDSGGRTKGVGLKCGSRRQLLQWTSSSFASLIRSPMVTGLKRSGCRLRLLRALSRLALTPPPREGRRSAFEMRRASSLVSLVLSHQADRKLVPGHAIDIKHGIRWASVRSTKAWESGAKAWPTVAECWPE